MQEYKCKKHGILDWNFDRIRTLKSGRKRLECKKCGIERSKEWRLKNHAHHLSEVKKWRSENKEYINKKLKEARKANPEKFREYEKNKREKDRQRYKDYFIEQRFNITLERYYEMIKEQNNKCYICGTEETRKTRNGDISRLCIDHNHETNIVRKLLCFDCNTMIGKAKENINILQSAISYLKQHEEK